MRRIYWAAAALALGMGSAQAAPVYSVLYNFTGTAGANPLGALVVGGDGSLYGTAVNGGANFDGAVFQLVPPAVAGAAWTASAIYSFAGPDGQSPYGDLILARGTGGLYGTTYAGGLNGNGTVYALSPPATPGGAWTHTTLHSFAGTSDGAHPRAGLFHCGGARLCGIGTQGGIGGLGTVFRLLPNPETAGAYLFDRLWQFTGDDAGSSAPYATVISDGAGGLIGTTSGYLSGNGAVYQLTPNANPSLPWQFGLLHSFGFSATDAYHPLSAPVRDASGTLYGSSTDGGTNDGGTVYRLSPPASAGDSWTSTLLASFGASCKPMGGLISDHAGGFIGTTSACGAFGFGTVFRLLPPSGGSAWRLRTLHDFAGGADGQAPTGALVRTSNGTYYGTTSGGNSGGPGTVYSIAP